MLKKFVRFGFIKVFRAMQIAVLASDAQRSELAAAADNIKWLKSPDDLRGLDAVIDLLFDNERSRADLLRQSGAGLIIVNAVEKTLNEIDPAFIRINGWPGFLKNKIIEASAANDASKKATEELFAVFNKAVEWLPDQPGFVTPRVIAMIINEAYFALQDNVSSKEDINTAMRTGTNYPFGPFEWAKEIGLEKIASLLLTLATINPRYQPSKLLLEDAADLRSQMS
jgi:3-hydroxybutyryl-CoA dehydrogenase